MLGWTSPVQPQLMSSTPPVGDVPLSKEDISWVGSINFIGAAIGTLFWGKVSDTLGRKMTGSLLALPFAVSWIVMLLAKDMTWMIAARIIVGIGCSGTIINVPLYIAEISEDEIRGALGSFLLLFLNAGVLFSYIIGSVVSFHTFSAICLTVPVLYFSLILWLPESPVYLYTQGQKEKAEASLFWFRGNDSVKTAKDLAVLQKRPARPKASFVSLFSTRGNIRALVLGVGFVLGQQLSGILAIQTYTVMIFQESGSSLTAHSSAIVVGSLQLVSSYISLRLVDRTGRKFLLASSYIIMSASLLALGSYFYFKTENFDDSYWGIIPIALLSLHVISFSLGAGPVPFIVMAETFTPEIRGIAMSCVQSLSTTLSFVTAKLFPTLTSLLGIHGTFWFYSVSCAFLMFFTILFVPETKGRTMHSILQQMNGDLKEKSNENEELCNLNTIKIVKSSKPPKL